MKALIVDDEPLARRRLRRMLAAIPEVDVVGEARDGFEALEMIRSLLPDVVFLDIRMPGLDGLSMARSNCELPQIVFTTAYHRYAVAAFAAEAVDYLLKPIDSTRLAAAVERVRRRQPENLAGRLEAVLERLGPAPQPPYLATRTATSQLFFDPREISRFSAERKYIAFSHGGRRHLLDDTIKSLAERLAPWGFLRTHRSELVNRRMVAALHVEGTTAALELKDGDRVPVSRRRLAMVRHVLGLKD